MALSAEAVRRKLRTTDRPYVTLKAAISLDGKIATRSGASKWITGPEAREVAHRLRALHDAILVGINTVTADDPRLTVRLPPGKSTRRAEKRAAPARVILDSRCRIAPSARCLAADGAGRIVIAGSRAPARRVAALRRVGVEVLVCASARPRPAAFLPLLRERGLERILVEGGGRVHANLIANGEADELFLLISGKVIGGSNAPGWCAALGIQSLEQAPRLVLGPARRAGDDLVIRGRFRPGA